MNPFMNSALNLISGLCIGHAIAQLAFGHTNTAIGAIMVPVALNTFRHIFRDHDKR